LERVLVEAICSIKGRLIILERERERGACEGLDGGCFGIRENYEGERCVLKVEQWLNERILMVCRANIGKRGVQVAFPVN